MMKYNAITLAFLFILFLQNVAGSEPRLNTFSLGEGESKLFPDQNVKIELLKINSAGYRSVTVKISQINPTSYIEGELIVNFKPQSGGVSSEMEELLRKII